MAKRIKSFFACVSAFLICTPCGIFFAGCTNNQKADIVVTTYPQYDWVMQVLGDNPAGLEVKYLLSNGVDLHNYEPSVQDTAAIIQSKLFVYIGETESKITPVLRNNPRPARRDVAMTGLVETKQLELDGADHEHAEDCFHSESGDEHVWLSLKRAAHIVSELAKEIGAIDPENAHIYQVNAESYREKLLQLDAEYEDAVQKKNKSAVLFADRFPFLYLCEDYGLTYYAAFTGCSAAAEISFDTKAFLVEKVKEHNLDVLLILENSSNRRIAESILSETSATKILQMHSLQSVNTKSAEGAGYLTAMRQNLSVLKEALA